MPEQQDHSCLYDHGVCQPTPNAVPTTNRAWNPGLGHTHGSAAYQLGNSGSTLQGHGGASTEVVLTDGAGCYWTIPVGSGGFLGLPGGERLRGGCDSIATRGGPPHPHLIVTLSAEGRRAR